MKWVRFFAVALTVYVALCVLFFIGAWYWWAWHGEWSQTAYNLLSVHFMVTFMVACVSGFLWSLWSLG